MLNKMLKRRVCKSMADWNVLTASVWTSVSALADGDRPDVGSGKVNSRGSMLTIPMVRFG